MADISVRSDQFEDGGRIPRRHAHSMAGGENVSPHLSWTGVPEGTESIAITCWDPDAPTTVGFTHWVRTGVARSATELAEGAGAASEPGHGITDWGDRAYGGMAPPEGDPPHHYVFTVYALDAPAKTLGLDDSATYAKFRFLIRGHVLASGTLTGLYAAGD